MVKGFIDFLMWRKVVCVLDCFTDYSQDNMCSLRSYRSFTNSLPSYLNCTLQFIQAFPPTAIKWLVPYTFFMNCSGQKLWESLCAYRRHLISVPSKKTCTPQRLVFNWSTIVIGPGDVVLSLYMVQFSRVLTADGEWLAVHVGSNKRLIHVQ